LKATNKSLSHCNFILLRIFKPVMYNLPYFKERDYAVLFKFIKEHSFALVIGSFKDRPVATQVPLLIHRQNEKLYLKGHIMRGTDHHKAFEKNKNVLCVFTGAHSYVSASWYTEQQTASTWNYMTVHASGNLEFLDDAALQQILWETTNYYENDAHSPANYEMLPADYVAKLSKAIVAFQIEVTNLQNVFKLSQNRNNKSYTNITNHLEASEDDGAKRIASEMKKRKDALFKKK